MNNQLQLQITSISNGIIVTSAVQTPQGMQQDATYVSSYEDLCNVLKKYFVPKAVK